MQTIIKAVGIQKKYGPLEILRGVDLEINAGEIVSIVGKSGAGKSTLLHILGTLDRADAGLLEIKNEEISRLSSKKLAAFRNRHIGFIFQFHHLLPEFSALENVCIPAMIGGGKLSDLKKRGAELLDYLGLADRLEHKPTELSGGEAQRVAVARALMNRPDVIFADEPTGNLDSGSSKDLHELILQLRRDFQQTFVLVTHNPDLANLIDRCLEMRDGQLFSKI